MVSQGEIASTYDALKKKYPSVHWLELTDDRPSKKYGSSVRPWALASVYKKYPELTWKHVFYFDADIIFRELPDFSKMLDGKCHLSDTISYIGYDYIKQFGENYVDAMCSVVHIDKEGVIENRGNSGGAQYFFATGVLSEAYWQKVYDDCEQMYSMLDAMVQKDKAEYEITRNPETEAKSLYAIQHWCADMWCVLWNLWLMGAVTTVDEKLSFSWATTPLSEWEKHSIYHNAGVTAEMKDELFYKSGFKTLPDSLDTSKYRTDVCSAKYVVYVERVINYKATYG